MQQKRVSSLRVRREIFKVTSQSKLRGHPATKNYAGRMPSPGIRGTNWGPLDAPGTSRAMVSRGTRGAIICPPLCRETLVSHRQPIWFFPSQSERGHASIASELKPLGTIVPWCSGGFRRPSIRPSWCRERRKSLGMAAQKGVHSQLNLNLRSEHLNLFYEVLEWFWGNLIFYFTQNFCL